MARKVVGYQVRPGGLLGYVKTGKQQRTKLFPLGTDPADIELWRAQTKHELLKARPTKGTLAGDITKFLEGLPEGRRKVDFINWLKKWTASPLGAKPRSTITREDVVSQFKRWGDYSGSSKNHLRQVALSLWRELDGPDAACPVKAIAKFPEAQPRKGFFSEEEIENIAANLPADYADAVEFFAITGWRSEEVKKLRWEEIDFEHRMIRLSPERAKNREGREFPMGPVEDIINRRMALRSVRKLDWVFTYAYGGKKTPVHYRPIGNWGKVWKKACREAGCPGALVHNFRRTAVRNFDKLGISRSVAMKLVGHKTEAIYRRYRIVDEAELHAAGELLKKKKEERQENS
jgi:integrase